MLQRKTIFSPCRRYRYTLWREWSIAWFPADGPNRSNEYLQVIGLNPSTADETNDDPTVRKCIGYAKRWGFGGLCMTNIFAWRDTLPTKMKRAAEPVGSENDRWLKECAAGAGMILAAWGRHGSHLDRGKQVAAMLPKMMALKINQDGTPMHPLYVPYDTVPIPFQ